MTEITTAAVTAVVIILTTLVLVKATKLFSRSFSQDSNGGVVPNFIPDTSTSSPPTCRSWKYDVFISFRGEDTRNTFVGHLYAALQRHGIVAYKDDLDLERGDTIGPSLLTGIHESNIALIIFSENYADSSWCLDELSHIMKCMEDSGQIVIPIFYKVDPSDVRKQKGRFGKGFLKLSKIKKNRVESWKKALVGASNIAGLEPKQVANGHEETFIQKIVDDILKKLSILDSAVVDKNLIGMGTRLQQLRSHLRIGSGGVRMVGIWGVGGIGKTTLANSLYKELKMFGEFHGCCFIEKIREASKQHDGLKSLQEKILSTVFNTQMQVESVELGKDKIKQMLCHRKVLIVLDDVDHLDQLEALAGSHEWFGDGSLLLITTRDQKVLISRVRVDKVYPVSLLSPKEANELLKIHAYDVDHPVPDYEDLSSRVISYVKGLPLALKILGRSLYGEDKNGWMAVLDKLKDLPNSEVTGQLKISYDGLDPDVKELFLDIACFHRGTTENNAMKMLDACGFNPRVGVKVLIQKALIIISEDGKFDMHDLVQEMGHHIVRGEHPYNPEKHSRVWRKDDIEDICSRSATEENDKIEAIQCYAHVESSNFIMLVSNMKKLRFLKVTTTVFDEGPSFLSNELRYIDWEGYPKSPFPENFPPMKLVVLKIEGSLLQKELWKGCKHLPCLKELKLVGARELVKTPDFGGLPCLQKLILDECGSLEEIHRSLGNHTSLVSVFIRECKKLKRFPTIVKMDKLEILRIAECKALIESLKIEANMDHLVTLSLENVGMKILPSTIGEYCTNLAFLRLTDCSKLESIDGNFHALKSLQIFMFYGCNQLEKLPTDLFNENLDGLGLLLDRSSIKQLSSSSVVPRFIKKLDFSGCNMKDREIFKHVADGYETKRIQEIAGSVLDKFPYLDSVVNENLVGMRVRLQQLKFQLRIGSGGVRMVGIWGLGGAGKTTLATSLYKECSPKFDGGCCFLGNIREESRQHGLKSLQEEILSTVFDTKMQVESVELGKEKIKRMLCHRKVLIVLDNVDHLDQLKALAGCREWFGDGSRIIITTRDQHLLKTHRVDEICPMLLLSEGEALQLFNRHAYNENKPVEDYDELSQQIVTYAAGLPLALIVLGSFLYDKDKDEWLSTLVRLKDNPELEIVGKIKPSYDGLSNIEKELFLDIACFFIRKKSKECMEMLDACGLYPHIGVKVLIQKALITLTGQSDKFDMHDLVQEMGYYIVRGEHPNNPEKHSRLWRRKDIEYLFQQCNNGTR